MKNNLQIKKLGDVCEFQNGFAFKSNLFKDKGLPVLRISNIQNDGLSYNRLVFFDKKSYKENFDKYQVIKGDLVIAMSGATTGKLAISNEDEIFYLNQRVGKFIPGDDLLKDYLYYYLSTQIEENLRISSGAAQPNLSTEQIKNFGIPLPAISEQHRIIKIINKVFKETDKVKENAEKNLQNSKTLFESYLQSIFTKKGKDWEEEKLVDVFQIKPPKKEAKEKLKDNDLVSFVPMEDMRIMSKEFICSKERKLKDVFGSYTYFANDDVLLAKITPCFENGKLGIARNLKNGIGFGSSEYIVFRSTGQVISDYLYYFLARDKFLKEGAKRMSGAVGHKRVSKEFVEENILSFPKSITEQKAIVKKLDELSNQTKKLEVIYRKKLADLEELKKSVLKKAFTGML
jgi:type I restriction enzyme S subunit